MSGILPTVEPYEASPQDFEAPPPESTLSSAWQSAALSMNNASAMGIMHNLVLETEERAKPGRVLSNEEVKDSPFFFDGAKGPIPENVLKLRFMQKRAQQKAQLEISNAPHTWFAGGTRWASGAIASAIGTPLPGVGKAFDLLGGRLSGWLAPKLTFPGGKLLAKAIPGALEGASVGAGITAINQEEQYRRFGVDPSLAELMQSMIYGGVTAGVIRTLVGYKPVIDQASRENIERSSGGQVEGGNDASPEPFLKTAKAAAEQASPEEIEEVQKRIGDAESRINAIEDEKKSINSDVDDIIENKRLKKVPTSPQILDAMDQIMGVAPDDITPEQRALIEKMPNTEHFDRYKKLIQQHSATHTEEEQQFLDNLRKNKESDLLKDTVEDSQQNIQDLESELEDTSPEKKDVIKRLKNKLIRERSRLEVHQNRLSDLSALEKESPAAKNLLKSLSKLELEQNDLKNLTSQTRTWLDLTRGATEGPTKEELSSLADQQASYKSNAMHDQQELDGFGDEIGDMKEKVPEDQERQMDSEINQMREEDQISEENEQMLDELDQVDDQNKTISSAIQDFIRCAIR